MSMSHDQLFESALSLPQDDRANLAFQLLQSLTPLGDEVSAKEFGAELHARVGAYRRGEVPSFSLEEARSVVEERLAKERGQ